MTDTHAAGPQQEGDITFSTEATAEETAADSQSEEDNQEGDTQSPEGENTQGDDEKPFHEHPRWTERETEWNKRFNDQETRHQDDLKAIREEFGAQRRTNDNQPTKPPVWFGGTQEQWDAYRADRDTELKNAEEGAIKRLSAERESSAKAEEKAVADATTFLRSEIVAIEGDKALNPSGTKIDQATAEKLLKTVLDNQLIDTQGRWNYRAGWKLLQAGTTVAPKGTQDTQVRKKIAAESTSTDKGSSGGDKSTIATSETFRKDRPW